jgi:hypothetical protein
VRSLSTFNVGAEAFAAAARAVEGS